MSLDWIIPVVLAVIVAPVALYVAYRRASKRAGGLRQVAARLGLTFDLAPPGVPHPELSDLPLFKSAPRSRVRFLLRGTHAGGEVYIFDYAYWAHSGSKVTKKQTVVAFPIRLAALPKFQLRPQRLLDRTLTALGGQDINFDDDPLFSEQFVLKGEDEAAVRTLFSPTLRRALMSTVDLAGEADRGLCIEGGAGWVIIYRARQQIAPEDIPPFLEEARTIHAAFETSRQRPDDS
jgi:hypothetical protein